MDTMCDSIVYISAGIIIVIDHGFRRENQRMMGQNQIRLHGGSLTEYLPVDFQTDEYPADILAFAADLRTRIVDLALVFCRRDFFHDVDELSVLHMQSPLKYAILLFTASNWT